MKVLLVGAEASPFFKVGGLGDVLGSLPQALCEKNIDARVIIPLYSSIKKEHREKLEFIGNTEVLLGWKRHYVGIFTAVINKVRYYLIDNEQFFERAKIYGEFDDAERFAFFSKAVLEAIPLINFYPDVIHVNDWHTGLLPVYLNTYYRLAEGYQNIKTVLSIHNIEFQGKYGKEILGDVLGLPNEIDDVISYDGCVNILKAAIESCNCISTVSETYATEIFDPYTSYGLDRILKPRSYKIRGIVNGIDTDLFNPETDKNIAYNYSANNLRNKVNCKKDLQKELGLEVRGDVPIIAMITRLTHQKGFDLIERAMEKLTENDIQFVLLGTGDSGYENFMRYWEEICHDKVRSVIKFSQEMASKIYAGADLFLMPSKTEPCGLSQMIAMRYGTIPIVHTVGGLKDTVMPFNPVEKTGNGITFQSYHEGDMLDAIDRALSIYKDKPLWRQLRKNAVLTDFSWEKSAQQYIDMYKNL